MTSDQLADELWRHWKLLWPLKPAERLKRILEIEADLIFREQLNAVRECMA
jgi:hypothetical protein